MTTHKLDGYNTVCRCGEDIGQIHRLGQEDFCSPQCVQKYGCVAVGKYPVGPAIYDPQTGCLSFPRRMVR